MKKLILFAVASSIIIINTNTSHSAQYWVKTYGGNGNDNSPSIQQTSDGGYILGGNTSGGSMNDTDILAIKLDSCGNIGWQKTYSKNENDVFTSIQETMDGGYIIAGYTGVGALYEGGYDAWILKLDAHGNIVWQKTYGGNEYYETIYSIQQTTDGGYIAVGEYQFSFDVDNAFWVLKLNADGDILWQRGYSNRIYGKAVQQTSDGGYVVLGVAPYLFAEPIVMKLDSTGTSLWRNTYSVGDPEMPDIYPTFIQESSDGGYILTYRYSSAFTQEGMLKLHSDGNVSWARNYYFGGGPNSSRFSSIQQTTDGGYIVAGYTASSGFGGQDALVLKLDNVGTIIWQKTYGGSNEERANYILQIPEEGYIIAGTTSSFGSGDSDIWVLKVDSNGTIPDCDIVTAGITGSSENVSFGRGSCCTLHELTPDTVSNTAISPQNSSIQASAVCYSGNEDYDCDGIVYEIDNCPYHSNPNQEDQYPPEGNGIGDFCDCEGDFDCDEDCDGADAATFKANFGRSSFNSPCNGINIFATGGSGIILHYNGSIWAEMETGTTQSLRDVWGGISESDIFAVGGSASLHYNGTSWSPLDIGTDSFLLDVWGTGANDVFVTGWDGDVYHYNGTSWTQMDSGGTYFLYGIWGSATDDVFVASYDGFIYHYNGTSWESMTSGTVNDLYAIGGTSADDVFAVGGNGTILHYEGTSWESMDSGTTSSLYEVWGTAPNDIYVVGSFGTILHYDGISWLPMDSGTTTSFNGIWGSGTDNIFAVGDQSIILHYDGTNWSSVPDVPYVTSSLTGIWGITAPPCNGDFDCDNDVDGTDAALFKSDFGRSEFNNPCPACEVEEWCS